MFNLDAEDELAHPGAHTPTAAMIARVESLLPQLMTLLGPGDVVLWPSDGAPLPPGMIGRAWCPTRWALEQMEHAKVEPPRTPSVEVLRAVNHRRFNNRLGQTLPGAGYAGSADELERILSSAPNQNWLLKRPFGFAGRGRKKLRPSQRTAADQSWIDASLRGGEGLQVEPLVERVLDCALHGFLDEEGHATFGRPTVQEVDDTGAWKSSRLALEGELTDSELEQLTTEAKRAGEALHQADYFGPFGLDAFRYASQRFQPRCEVNARYSMGWAVGMNGSEPLTPTLSPLRRERES